MRPAPAWFRIAAGIVLAELAVLAVARGLEQGTGGDFHAFWVAGGRFLHGERIYQIGLGERSFYYPPFAALCFAPLALLPFSAAAVGFSLLNVGWLAAAYWLTARLLVRTGLVREPWAPALVGALVLSGQYFLDNINLVQTNALVLVRVLAGLDASLRRLEWLGAALLGVATGIKLVPGAFLVWAGVRLGRRALFPILPITALIVGLPLLIRGPAQGWQDLTDYEHSFLHRFAVGRVEPSYTNQNLGALVYRLTQPSVNPEALDYRLVPASPETAELIYQLGWLTVLLAWLGHLVRLRQRADPVGGFELAATFLAGHLLAGITWKAHLVSLLFVFGVLLAVPIRRLTLPLRIGADLGLVAALLLGLNGRDIVGWTVHHYIGGYSLITWCLIGSFVLMLLLAHVRITEEGASPASR